MKNLNFFKTKAPFLVRSNILPGVPTTTVGGSLVSFLICSASGSPPMNTPDFNEGKYFPSLSNSL